MSIPALYNQHRPRKFEEKFVGGPDFREPPGTGLV
jgi:hypothetical protein